MTEQQNLNQNFASDNSVSSGVGEISHEEMVPKSHMSKVVHERYNEGKSLGYEKGYQAALAKYSTEQAQSSAQMRETQSPDALSEIKNEILGIKSQLEKKDQEIAERERQTQMAEVFNQLKPKIEEAQKRHSDFNQVVKPEDLQTVPLLPAYLNEVDNGGEVMYELLNNPERLGQICGLPSPNLIRRAIRNLSNTLKTNQASSGLKIARDPISQVQASNVNSVNSGDALTIRELRRKYRV